MSPPRARLIAVALGCLCASAAAAQRPPRAGATVTGRVLEAATGAHVVHAVVTIEGAHVLAVSDTAGRFHLGGVPPGPQVLLARRIGYAPARVSITASAGAVVVQDIRMAGSVLRMPEITVTADRAGRAEGELGTASVIDRAAIQNQTAASLAGVLELLPGVPLQPPGLDNVQQFSLRSVPTSTETGFTAGGPSASDLASLGTLIILDGVPLSNNANLQTTGPRGELQALLSTTGGGGVDLRRIPAATIERVEAIRGIPSARYGDLTQGVVVVDTRAGVVQPTASLRFDPRSVEASLLAGRGLGPRHLFTTSADVAHTRISPGLRDDRAYRITAGLAHRASLGTREGPGTGEARVTLDTKLDYYQVYQDSPEDTSVVPGRASSNHDSGLRLSERARLGLAGGASLTFTGALDYTRQRSSTQSYLVRGAMPFTDRTDAGRAVGHFVGGQYLARLRLEGDARLLYGRLEADAPWSALGFTHRLRAGAELRREWNGGPGYLFDIEFPPQVTFNGVNGFDRPRRFDALPPVATSALYVDDRLIRVLWGNASLDVQAGLRADLLHRGTTWASGVRDAALQPRLNAQLTPWPWLRLRAGTGRSAKSPTLLNLYPAPQYFDVVNVNWYANDPAERLAVLTTFVRDPTNPDLGFSIAHKAEAGVEIGSRREGMTMSLVAFRDRTTDGVGFRHDPGFLLREHFDLTDSAQGTGRPPTIIEPASSADTVPILVDRPANILTLDNHGYEATLSLPEVKPLGLVIEVQGAWAWSKLFTSGVDFGSGFGEFQLNGRVPRSPYWDGVTRTGERAIVTYRLIHRQPRLGLVITAVIEHIVRERRQDVGGTDTLAFAGYVTRSGELVPVPPAQRADNQYRDLHQARGGILTQATVTPADWLMSLQVSKALPLDGELRFYAFNVLDRMGSFGESGLRPRQFPPVRFGLEVTLPLGRMPAPAGLGR